MVRRAGVTAANHGIKRMPVFVGGNFWLTSESVAEAREQIHSNPPLRAIGS